MTLCRSRHVVVPNRVAVRLYLASSALFDCTWAFLRGCSPTTFTTRPSAEHSRGDSAPEGAVEQGQAGEALPVPRGFAVHNCVASGCKKAPLSCTGRICTRDRNTGPNSYISRYVETNSIDRNHNNCCSIGGWMYRLSPEADRTTAPPPCEGLS